jgi:VWFA-related protein
VMNLERAFNQIAEELRHQYALGYYPTNAARDGSYRKIRVRVMRANLAVRAREGYRAEDAQANANGRSPQQDRNRPKLRTRD